MNYAIIMSGVVGLTLIGALADSFLKAAGAGPQYVNTKALLIGVGLYCLIGFGWFFVMKHVKLSVIGTVYGLCSTLFLVLIGVFYFKEKLTPIEIVGLIGAIISILMLSRFR
jgi:multidrug transporter EmrE-like cation transporter